MLKSQKTKPWTTGIKSHQQITDLSVAWFPEICNTLHMGTKCVPDVMGFMCCSRCSVCTPRSVLCHQKTLLSLISASHHGRHFHELLFMTTHVSIHFPIKIRGGLWLFSVNPADLSHVLIEYCLRKRLSGSPLCPFKLSPSWFFIRNQ